MVGDDHRRSDRMNRLRGRLGRWARLLVPALALMILPTTPARAQFFGAGYGYPGYGMGSVYGFPGAAGYGYPAMGYGFGYPFGAYSVFGYPGFGYGGFGAGMGGYGGGGYSGYGYGYPMGAGGFGSGGFGVSYPYMGPSPLAVGAVMSERYINGGYLGPASGGIGGPRYGGFVP